MKEIKKKGVEKGLKRGKKGGKKGRKGQKRGDLCIAGGKKGGYTEEKRAENAGKRGVFLKKSEIKRLIRRMTLKQKLCQLTQENVAFLEKEGGSEQTGPDSVTEFREEEKWNVGSVLNFQGAAEARRVQTRYLEKTAHGIPLLFMQDVVHGYKTIYPVNLGLACSFDPALIEELSSMAAREAALNGVKVTFAPMLDLVRDARWGRVVESCGEDPFLTCEIAKASVRGFQGDLGKNKIAACLKHFAAYGACEAGRDYNTVDLSERTLREYYLPPFRVAVESGVRLAMPAFNIFNGIPMIANRRLLDGVLRREWGFDGVIISDYNAYYEEVTHGYAENEEQAALYALRAGADVEMVSASLLGAGEKLVREGKIREKDIDRALLRFLTLKNDLGLFERPFGDLDEEEEKRFCLSPENRALARRAAAESAVLLKNDGLLPLSEQTKKIAVVGPFGRSGDLLGRWRCRGNPEDTVTVVEGLKRALPGAEIVFAPGCSAEMDEPDESGFAEAIQAAAGADAAVLCIGEAVMDAGEGTSKQSLALTGVQQRLFEAITGVQPRTAVVLFTGRPLTIPELDRKARAILNVWFPGTEGGNAVADLLLGRENPSGKLAMSFPYSVGQCPIYYNHYQTGRPRPDDTRRCPYSSSYIDGPNRPLYPFGYGLSYTSFSYSAIRADRTELRRGKRLTFSVTVENTGSRSGQTVAQLYIRDWAGSTVRPVRELKGFQRILLRPGEKRELSFSIEEETLAFFGADGRRKAEKGAFSAFIGPDSETQNRIDFTFLG